ncbi:MAG: tyrosine-type recombinase/integrase [Pirellulaceae bacterium]|nr:tyrosine-type recombinase/integrase [Pirellulaceae bacterium]
MRKTSPQGVLIDVCWIRPVFRYYPDLDKTETEYGWPRCSFTRGARWLCQVPSRQVLGVGQAPAVPRTLGAGLPIVRPGTWRRVHLRANAGFVSGRGGQAYWPEAVAVSETGLTKRVTCHTFRHSFAPHWLASGYDIRTDQEFLRHSEFGTTMTYTHVLHRGGKGVRSPADGLTQGFPEDWT